jgi:hypothetical protein
MKLAELVGIARPLEVARHVQEADDMAAVSRRVVLAVLKDAKLDVSALSEPLT